MLVISPPPMASKASVAPVSAMASSSLPRKSGSLLSRTCVAPRSRRSWACAGLRTMLTSPIPSALQILTSICPRFEAAGTWTIALCPSARIVSTKPSAVSGLTNSAAPSAAPAPSGRTMQASGRISRSSAYMAPPIMATRRPTRSCRSGPAAITVPAPSLPTGMDWSSRARTAGSSCCGTCAVRTGASSVPSARSVAMSAGPNSRPRSEGLIGAASTRTSNSPGPGSGTVTRSRLILSVPSAVTVDRSSRLLCGMMSSHSEPVVVRPAWDRARGRMSSPPRSPVKRATLENARRAA